MAGADGKTVEEVAREMADDYGAYEMRTFGDIRPYFEKIIAKALRQREQETVKACLAEFDVPVEYRPVGWHDKAPALRQRGPAEVRAAIISRFPKDQG